MSNTPENPSVPMSADNQTPQTKSAPVSEEKAVRTRKPSSRQKTSASKRAPRTRKGPAPVAIDALGEFAPPAPRKRTVKAKASSADASDIKTQSDFMKAQARALSAVPMQELLRAQRQMNPEQQTLISKKTGLTAEKPAEASSAKSNEVTRRSSATAVVDLVDEEVPSAEAFAKAARKLAEASAKEKSDLVDVAPSTSETTSEEKEEKKPATRKTTRKTTAKTRTVQAKEETDTAEISAEVETKSTEEVVEETKPAKRKYTRRKKVEEQAPVEDTPSAQQGTAQPEPESSEQTEEAKKPKRKITRRKKVVEKTPVVEDEATEKSSDVPVDEPSDDALSTQQSTTQPEAESSEQAEEAPKPKRRTTRRKKTAIVEDEKPAAVDAAEEAPQTFEASAEDAASEQVKDEQSEPAVVEEEQPKRVVRRRRTRKVLPTEEEQAATADVASEPESQDEQTNEADDTTDAVVEEANPNSDEVESSADDTQDAPIEETDEAGEHSDSENESDSEEDEKKTRRTHVKRAKSSDTSEERSSRHERPKRKILTEPSLSMEAAQAMKVVELRAKAEELKLDVKGMRKAELVEAVYKASARAEGFREIEGMLEIARDGHGYIRTKSYVSSREDAFVPINIVRGVHLRQGDWIQASLRPSRPGDRLSSVGRIKTINGVDVTELGRRPKFADLTPIYPNEQLVMEHGRDSITGRAIDIVSPVGKGQRGLIVSPPKAGKTTVLKHICQSIAINNPEVHLICLLVDERPEEVTDMQRSIAGEVVASTFDMPPENHTRIAELVIERAKRLVEMGEDVVVVLDSITRLARAYNLAAPASGRILSGGVDSASLYPPKRFLGAARNIENGGSLTILASALIDTGSKMDEVIFEEFKGTGNMELKLDRDLADRRIFPAIDPVASGTRNEDLLIDEKSRPFVWGIRRILANMNNTERSAASFIKGLKQTDNNEEFLIRSAKKAADHEESL